MADTPTRYKLILHEETGRREIDLGPDPAVVGRSAENSVQVNHASISRRHCEVRFSPEGVELRDLESSNGTWVNDERISRSNVRPGDDIRFGHVRAEFVALRGDEPPEPDEIEIVDVAGETPAAAGPSEYTLIVVDGETAGERHPLPRRRITVGRSAGNDIRVKGLGVSGRHAEIVWEKGAPVLRDLDSTNGVIHAGQRVESVVLKHGLVVGIGKVSVRVEGPVEEIEIGGDLDLEDGSAEIADETLQFHQVSGAEVPRRRRVGAFVGLGVLLLGLAAAAYFSFTPASSGRLGGHLSGAVEVPSDSLLRAGFSAEEAEAAEWWTLGAGKGGSLARVSAAARTGRFGYALERGEEADASRPTIAVYHEPLPVDARRRYELSGWVRRESGDGDATLLVRFLNPAGEVVQESFGGRVRSETAERVELTPTVPEGVNRVEVGLAAWGGKGTFHFDDLVLRPSALAAATVSHAAGRFSIVLFPAGVWSLQEGSGWLLRRAEYFVESEAGRFPQAYFARPGGEGITVKDGVTRWVGTLEGPERKASPLGLSIAGSDVVTFTYEPWKGEGAKRDGLTLWLRREDLREGILVASGGDVAAQKGPFSMEAVTALVLGTGTRKIRLVLDPPLDAELTEVDGDLRLALTRRHAPDETFSVRLNTSIIDLMAAARTALDKGRDALGHERYGDAYRYLNQLLGEFAVEPEDVETAHGLIAQVQTKFRERFDEIKDRAENAEFFKDRNAVGSVLQDALALQRAYQNTPVEGEARSVVEKLDKVRAELEASRLAGIARRLLLLARDAKERGDVHFAEEYYRAVIDRCAGTPFEAEARNELAEMRKVAAELERKPGDPPGKDPDR